MQFWFLIQFAPFVQIQSKCSDFHTIVAVATHE